MLVEGPVAHGHLADDPLQGLEVIVDCGDLALQCSPHLFRCPLQHDAHAESSTDRLPAGRLIPGQVRLPVVEGIRELDQAEVAPPRLQDARQHARVTSP